MIDTDSLTWKVLVNTVQAKTRHVVSMYFISVCGRDNWVECVRCGRVLLRNVASVQDMSAKLPTWRCTRY